MALVNYRTIDIDALDADSPANFDLSTLTPGIQPVSTADVTSTAGQIRQLLRGGDAEGALRGALESVPYGADARGKVSLFGFDRLSLQKRRTTTTTTRTTRGIGERNTRHDSW